MAVYNSRTGRSIYLGSYPGAAFVSPGLTPRKIYHFHQVARLPKKGNTNKISDEESRDDFVRADLSSSSDMVGHAPSSRVALPPNILEENVPKTIKGGAASSSTPTAAPPIDSNPIGGTAVDESDIEPPIMSSIDAPFSFTVKA